MVTLYNTRYITDITPTWGCLIDLLEGGFQNEEASKSIKRSKWPLASDKNKIICTFYVAVRLSNLVKGSKTFSEGGVFSTELCKIIPAKLEEFLPIFPKMADGQEEAGLSSLAALRRENSNMQESFYTTL